LSGFGRTRLLELRHRAQIFRGADAHREASWRQSEHRPITATLPGTLEGGKRHLKAPIGARAQDNLLLLQVVADRNSVMPGRVPIEGQILQHDHRGSRGDFGEEIGEARLELYGDEAVA